jgi:hypothetical protein
VHAKKTLVEGVLAMDLVLPILEAKNYILNDGCILHESTKLTITYHYHNPQGLENL